MIIIASDLDFLRFMYLRKQPFFKKKKALCEPWALRKKMNREANLALDSRVLMIVLSWLSHFSEANIHELQAASACKGYADGNLP